MAGATVSPACVRGNRAARAPPGGLRRHGHRRWVLPRRSATRPSDCAQPVRQAPAAACGRSAGTHRGGIQRPRGRPPRRAIPSEAYTRACRTRDLGAQSHASTVRAAPAGTVSDPLPGRSGGTDADDRSGRPDGATPPIGYLQSNALDRRPRALGVRSAGAPLHRLRCSRCRFCCISTRLPATDR